MIQKINFLTIVILPIGFILVQILLSKNDKKYPGLIIPILNFLFSIVAIIQTPNLKKMLSAFIMCNTTTVIALTILYICQRNIKKKNQITKMKIQDLE